MDGNDAADAERQYRRSNLYAIDLATGTKRRITSEEGGWSGPVISPDGRLIAFTGQPAGAQLSHRRSVHDCARRLGDDSALRRPRPGSRRHCLVSGRKGIYFAAQDRGTSNIWYAALGAAPRQVTTGTHMISAPSIAKNGVAFAVRTNPSLPPDVVRIDLKKPAAIAQLTAVNADLLTGTRLGEVEEIWYTSSGGVRVQGWLVKPPSFDPRASIR